MKKLLNEQLSNISGGEPRGVGSDGRMSDGTDVGQVYEDRGTVTVIYHKPDGRYDGHTEYPRDPSNDD